VFGAEKETVHAQGGGEKVNPGAGLRGDHGTKTGLLYRRNQNEEEGGLQRNGPQKGERNEPSLATKKR